jgi:hypothetical protein
LRKELALFIGRSYQSLINSEGFLGLDKLRNGINSRTIIFPRQKALEKLKAAGLLVDEGVAF